MKHFLYLVVALLSSIQFCSAASLCVNGSLQSYLTLGSTGCLIGGSTFSDFQIVSGTTGATPIDPTAVTIAPFGGATDPGIQGMTNLVATGDLLESIFTYRVSGRSYTDDTITLANSSETGLGDVSEVQNFCAGGTFGSDGVSGCTGTPGSLLTVDGVQNQNMSALGPASFLSITDDFTLDGTFGSAAGGTFSDQFNAVPEPVSFLLSGIGLMFVLTTLRVNSQRSL